MMPTYVPFLNGDQVWNYEAALYPMECTHRDRAAHGHRQANHSSTRNPNESLQCCLAPAVPAPVINFVIASPGSALLTWQS